MRRQKQTVSSAARYDYGNISNHNNEVTSPRNKTGNREIEFIAVAVAVASCYFYSAPTYTANI